jgi:CRP-like cAMP-binding protein
MLLQSDIIEEFRKAGIPRSYRANEPIFLHDEPATGVYLVLKGEAKVIRRKPTGENAEVATVKPGETIGEISLLMEKPHTATVIAKTEMETLLVTRNRLQELKRQNPELALRLYEIFAVTLARHLYERPW